MGSQQCGSSSIGTPERGTRERCQMFVLLRADNDKRYNQSTAKNSGADVAPALLSGVVGVVDVHEMIVFSHGSGRTNTGLFRNLHGRGIGNIAARADITLQSNPAGGSRTDKTLTQSHNL